MAQCPDLAVFSINGKSLLYRGNLVTTADGCRWLHLGPLDEVCTRIDVAHAVFVADNFSEMFLHNVMPGLLRVEGNEDDLPREPMRASNRV